MKLFISLFISLNMTFPIYPAGGKPLAPDVALLVQSQQALRDKLHSDTSPDAIVNDLLDVDVIDYDPEYAQILSDIDRRHSLYKLTHRDLQWQTVAVVMQELDNDARVELVQHVRRHPLHRRLPATVAMSPKALNNWQNARAIFLKAIKRGVK